ncbi:hypothetical protein [Flavobacterium ovatum]|uniref:hypothetical protein n=1 Tax=Flavobacterium ovatum TaxID=1928857 RepID=UPI00344E4214
MRINAIYSDRHFQKWPSHQIVYEWEDEIAKGLGIKIVESPIPKQNIFRLITKIAEKIFKNDLTSLGELLSGRKNFYLYFSMYPMQFVSFSNRERAIPIIIDFWIKDIQLFDKYYQKCSLVLISSKEVYTFLKENNSKVNIKHFPLSLPSKYQGAISEKKRDIDVIVLGRKNEILWDYLQQYEKENPEIEYVFQVQIDGRLKYKSNKRGIIGDFHEREDYMQLANDSKVALYGTPGIDGGEQRTNGFNPVTPKYLEFIAAGCTVMARYPKNDDTDFYQMNNQGASIDTYIEFKKQLDTRLKNYDKQSNDAINEYLNKHNTKARIELLKSSFTFN